jgi:AbrB family looped-hinge helix DNA binding protein
MSVATLTSKGQITLPQSVRTSLGVQAGDKLDFVADDAGGFRVVALRKDVHALRGRFAGRVAKSVSVQDMNEAVQAEAAARARPLRSTPRAATK